MSSQNKGSALHYVECATCKKYSKFYCNTCHQRMCDKCRDSHLREKENRRHDIDLYQNRIKELPEEKCQIHPKNNLQVYCKDCHVPVCLKCFGTDHNGHRVLDLETVYNESLQQNQKEFVRIQDTILPQSIEKLKFHRQRVEDVRKDIEKLRISMKKSADEIKAVVDVILTENNAKLDIIERSILHEMAEEEKTSQEYISSLEKMIEDFENAMSSAKPTDVLRVSKDKSNISVAKSVAGETVLPEFEKGAVIKGEIEEQFGKICQRKREVLKEEDKILHTEKKLILNATIKSTVQNVSSVVQIMKIDLFSICAVFHLSVFKFGFWASDDIGNLIQFNKEGYPLTKGPCVPNAMGFHTISHAGELIFIHNEYHAVCKLNYDMTVTYIINTKDWEPTSICFSHINKNILLGMVKGTEQMVARYRKKKTQYREQDRCYLSNLCENITYLTENINGDICISDSEGNKVLVVTASGEFRFSYLGHQSQSGFLPFGICTDVLGHILVCNDHRDSIFDNSSIHILDKNGTFLFLLPAPDKCPLYPGALCIDDHQNLLVGCYTTPTLTVYKYMHLFTEDK